MKVKALVTTKYKNKYYFAGDTFEIEAKDYDVMKEVVKQEETNQEAISNMRVKELKEIADEKGIKYPPNVKKDELISLLEGGSDDKSGDA